MKKLIIALLVLSFFTSCIEDNFLDKPYPCLDGKCSTYFEIDPKVSPGVYQDNNGFHHIQHHGPKYFTISGILSELDPYYVINGIPLIEVKYNSDYWILIDENKPPLNIAGYKSPKDFCWECPYSPSLMGSYSKYNYTPRQMFFLDYFMTEDTLKVLVETTFNFDIGSSVIIEDVFNIIVD